MAGTATKLRRIQFGKETTPGTLVVATALMRWNGAILSEPRDTEVVPEQVGRFGGDVARSLQPKPAPKIAVAETMLNPEQVPYLLAMMYGGPVTGTADGTASSGYKYATSIPVTSAVTNTAYSAEVGGQGFRETLTYCKCRKVSIKGSSGKPWTMTAELIGSTTAALSSYASVTAPTVNDLLFNLSKFYFDAPSAGMGTTQLAGVLGLELTYEGLWEPEYTGDGTLNWTAVTFTDYKITGKITILGAARSSGFGSAYYAKVQRFLRVDMLGAAYATPGTGTTLAGVGGIRNDLAIVFTDEPEQGDENGIATFSAPFEAGYHPTLGNAGAITACNEVSALP